MQREQMRVVVLVKASPVLTSQLDEMMCVAGVRVDQGREWVRLHPVPFRDLGDDKKFVKYQVVRLEAIRPRADRRPESWTPVHGTIALKEVLGREGGWAARRQLIHDLGEATRVISS